MSNSKSSAAEGETRTRTIKVGALARVEGEGGLELEMVDGHCRRVHLDIYEPPRFYEAFLRGRDFREVPDITARICGICPVAYQASSCHALEKAMGIFQQVDPALRALRNLIYCGEWIESHVLHMFLLHLPDFLGQESALSLIATHGPVVKQALRLKKLGNALLALLGGRAVHPVGMCVGGFHGVPDKAACLALAAQVKPAVDEMAELTLFLAQNLEYPQLERDYEFVALCPPNEYPMNLGRIRSNKGLDLDQEEFLQFFEERHVPHSTALHAQIKGRGHYLVGPLARLNLNADKLHPRARELVPRICQVLGKPLPWNNNFLSLLARGLETVHALALSLDLLQAYEPPLRPCVPCTPRAGIGGHGTEAPRGVCWHQYRTEADGTILSARIIPPTSQNLALIEDDLMDYAPRLNDLAEDDARLRCEHLIRNYDPCISCSVHALRFTRTFRGTRGPAG
jgi:coenzyme F420-reducing hydrogenase alpha subunit